jgi:glycerophosphoryl diester phosphodiesterase
VRWLVEHGADAVELDVRRTRDGVLVVHHDAHWRDMPLASTDYGDMARDEESPRKLEDVLAATGGGLALDVELKESGYEDDVVSLALTQVGIERLVVTSFLDEAVLAVKSRTPAVRAGLIVGRSAAPRVLLADALPFSRLRRCGADFLAPNVRLLVTGLRRRARNRGIPLLLWDVDDDVWIRRYLEDPGVIGVVTDSPRALAEPPGGPAEGWPLEPGRFVFGPSG